MSNKTDGIEPISERVLRGAFGSKPELDPGFNATVLAASRDLRASRPERWSWRGWVMCVWWALSILLVSYGLAHSSILEEGSSSLPLIIALATLLACALLIFALLRFCGVRLSDTLLSTLELG